MKMLLLAVAFLSLLGSNVALAGSATWNLNPTSSDWNVANNWTPQTVPSGPSDTATFATSNQTAVSLSGNFDEVSGINFSPAASAFTITAQMAEALTISGTGISNSSGITQNFVTFDDYSSIYFSNSATAGDNTHFTTSANGGGFFFHNISTAGNGIFTINGPGTLYLIETSTAGDGNFTLSTSEFYSCYFQFSGSASAGNGIFTANCAGYRNELSGGFYDTASAGNCVFTLNGGDAAGGVCSLIFRSHSTAGNATLIANAGISGGAGGKIALTDASSGGTARVELFGNAPGHATDGTLDIAGNTQPTVTIGSLEGSGLVRLGLNKLTVGGNNLSTVFSGTIRDGGSGSLVKSGGGKFTLSNVNTYGGGTAVTQGSLLVTNRTGSATGSGALKVNAGTLGGRGTIGGAVTVGTGSGTGAFLAPGVKGPDTLAISKTLTFKADGSYKCQLSLAQARADQVAAKGVTIESGAQFLLLAKGNQALTAGTVFTVISNAATTPISGTFANLADGSAIAAGPNNLLASYEGGDGNDLTLTVVP